MIIVLKPRTTKDDVSRVENMVKKRGLNTHVVQGEEMTVIGCIGDTAKVDSKLFEIDSAVDKVMHVQEPYKLANRAFHPEDSIIDVSGVKVGGDNLAMIAGPCSVESYEQVLEIAQAAKASGANLLRRCIQAKNKSLFIPGTRTGRTRHLNRCKRSNRTSDRNRTDVRQTPRYL